MNEGMEKVYRKVLRPDTELDIQFVPRSTLYTSHTYLEVFNNAEVIVTGCAAYAALTLAGHTRVTDTVVPIVESVAVGIKQAEMLGDLKQTLGLSHSKHLTYQNYLTNEQRDGLLAAFV